MGKLDKKENATGGSAPAVESLAYVRSRGLVVLFLRADFLEPAPPVLRHGRGVEAGRLADPGVVLAERAAPLDLLDPGLGHPAGGRCAPGRVDRGVGVVPDPAAPD